MHKALIALAMTGSILAVMFASYENCPKIDWQPSFLDSMAPFTVMQVNPPEDTGG